MVEDQEKRRERFVRVATELSGALDMLAGALDMLGTSKEHVDAIDLSDLGNTVGVIVGRHFSDGILGYEKEDFINGLEHGISLVDGSHG